MKKELTFYGLLMLSVLNTNAQSGYFDKYITDSIVFTTVATNSQKLAQPRDLDFKPNSNELWICNNGNSDGGSMVIFYNAGLPGQSSQYRKDSHTGHFKIYPSAMAFGDDGFWANTNEIKNTANESSTFMGPALWTADTSIFAKVFQNDWEPGLPLGSHYDMLHQSPFSMGIAHDTNLVYWVNDGYNGNICKYDFVKHHGPGYDNHSAGKIWRYTDVTVNRVTNVPSHMVMDKQTGWLYYVDGGSKTIRRMQTRTGSVESTLSVPSTSQEPLAGYWKVTGATVEILDSFTTQPCGIDFYRNRLVVSDYTNGNIYVYKVDSVVTRVRTIATGRSGMMGIKVGPDSRIWCVNYTDSKLYRLDINSPTIDVALTAITSPLIQNFMPNFYHTGNNVCNGSVSPAVKMVNRGNDVITSIDFEYTIDNGSAVAFNWTGSIATGTETVVTLPPTAVASGAHLVTIRAVNINGSSDEINQNNTITGSFRVVGQVAAASFSEEFSSTAFPPPGWNYINYNPNNKMERATTGGFGSSVGCLKMANFSGEEDVSGQIDYFMSPAIDFTASSPAWMHFNVAYVQYSSATNDKLEVRVSTNCGETWTTAYSKEGANLSTATPKAINWTPSATQWRKESVNLAPYAGLPNVIFMFTTTSNFGNNLYLDDIKMDNTVGLNDAALSENRLYKVYPNPSEGVFMLSKMDGMSQKEMTGTIYSYDGKLLSTFMMRASETQKQLDLSYLPDGIYAIQLTNGQDVVTTKIIKQ